MAISPSVIAGLAGAGIGGLQALLASKGIKDMQKKAEESIANLPTYSADPEIQRALDMRKARLGMGLGATTRQIAEQGIGTAAAQATRAATQFGRGAGLSSIGAIQRQAQRGIQQLAMQEEQAQEMNRRAFEGAARMSATERTKQFASEQEKEQLKTNVQLEKLAARRAAIGQGLSGITSAATGLAMSGLGGKTKTKTKEGGISDIEELSFRY
jgi:hypothetical protein